MPIHPPVFLSQYLMNFVGREFTAKLKGHSETVSGTLNQVMNDVLFYTPSGTEFSEGILFFPEISTIEFKPVQPAPDSGSGT